MDTFRWMARCNISVLLLHFNCILLASYLQQTSHSENYATSKEIPQDVHDEEYEIDTFDVSPDDDKFGDLQGRHEYPQE